ncbi:MAG: T9SS type A sorting domain-containing protein, partial [Candidatus Eisenbacteria bacterium]|nr:T9SS type A sorting domain-containing protein [Candidatus Eisenbacteria bacterium]
HTRYTALSRGLGDVYKRQEARMDWPKIRRDIENHGCFCGVLDPAAVGEADLSSPAAFSIRVSPNPYLGGPLRLSGLPGNGGKVDILDPAGRLVGSARIAGSGRDSGAGEAILPSRRLANGIYLLRFTSEEGRSAFARLLVLER